MNNGQVNPPNVVFDRGTAQWWRAGNGEWRVLLRVNGELTMLTPEAIRAIYAAMPSELKDGNDAAAER